MKFLKTSQIVLLCMFFLQIQVSAQFSQLNIDMNINPHFEVAMAQGTQNDDFALVREKTVFSTDTKKRKYKRYIAPAIEKVEKVDGENIVLSKVSEQGHYTVKIDDDYDGEVHFQFLDSKARLLERKTKFIRDGKNKIAFKNDYKPGTYLLTVNYDGETFLRHIVIE